MLCLSELHTLVLECYGNATSMAFGSRFVQGGSSLEQRLISSLHNFLRRSQCSGFPSKLDTTSDYGIALQLVFLVPLSTLLPVLTIQPKSSPVLLPRLERLYCSCHRCPTLEDMALLIELVRSRWHPHESAKIRNRLAFFEFKAEHPPPALRGALAPLLVSRDEGLELRVDEFYVGINSAS